MATILENRQARHRYFIEERLEAGLVLEGWEVKAILAGRANFNGGGAFIRLTDGEAWLEAMTITPLPETRQGLLVQPQASRARKLLLSRAELNKLSRRVAEKGYTVVPLEVVRGRKLKLNIGLARGKNVADKRESIKARDLDREVQRDLAARG
ncbi:SsrA-binding protein SmpB [Burkholderia multivorans]|uniref:SsrA-binding protein SmpB n=1 Tax=Burkholderia multivorans TaxID=87883 RepID=UPI001C22C37C|nr:SsrA-binding protein SmpB [Burkholderia multivorans]MBU9200244.1 SsrA-binding protein SmpB [Burkholderia multivorans]MDN8078629.1 SsrA-binding protein SmpB [Burkholderia multivorans]